MNENPKSPIKSFTDLNAWKEAHVLTVIVYKITREFPKEELYSLIDQMRRVAISIGSNIAEGFGRQSYKEKVQFYYIAQGSLTELKNQLLVAKDIGYLKGDVFREVAEQANKAHALLQGLIKKSKEILKS